MTKIEMIQDREGLSLSKAKTPHGRYINVYRCDDVIEENGEVKLEQTWILDAGQEGMPADYTEKHDSIDSLLASMRKMADLRSWVPAQYE